MARQRAKLVAMRALAFVVMCGCSFAAVDAPAKIPTTYKLRCSPIAPIVDTLFVVGGGALIYKVKTSDTGGPHSAAIASAFTGLVALTMVGNGLGAIYGWSTWPRCVRLRDAPPIDYAKAFGDEAVARAGRGDCNGAMTLSAYVAKFDRAYYVNTFLKHANIVFCVARANSQYAAEHAARIEQAAAAKRRSDALALVKQARDAARAGDCAAVVSLRARIEALDAQTYEVWFAKDPEIAACLPK